MAGRITLVGAGELMSAMSRVHRDALARVPAPPRPVFLDVTAGFETNVDAIVGKAVEYYRHHLQAELRVASYRHRERATSAEIAAAIAEIRAANLIFAGPGSPTYAIRHWQESPVWDAVVRRFEEGADLLFASAAAITTGRYALPVYEIFKVGEDPFWAEGLDLLGRLGLSLAVIPHFDDNSGGDNYDTRFCYVGAARFDVLQEKLPPEITILGIDAYTAISFDSDAAEARVVGQNGVTVIGDGAQRVYAAGSRIPFDAFSSSARRTVVTSPQGRPASGYEFTDGPASDGFQPVTTFIEGLSGVDETKKAELIARIQGFRQQMEAAPANHEDDLIDVLVELRSALRQLKRFDLADRARDVLNDLGIEIADSANGSSWTRR